MFEMLILLSGKESAATTEQINIQLQEGRPDKQKAIITFSNTLSFGAITRKCHPQWWWAFPHQQGSQESSSGEELYSMILIGGNLT